MKSSSVKQWKRSYYCGELRTTHQSKTITVMGWVKKIRDHGQLIFVDIRDKTGYVQVVFDPSKQNLKSVLSFSIESVVAVEGIVKLRPKDQTNEKTQTGQVEIIAEKCEILSSAKTPPFLVDDKNVSENLVLKYRYLHLRSAHLQKNLQLSHEVYQILRTELSQMGFIEVFTPALYKTTPEGARDYLVPSRIHPGSFYALVQSPQTLKQLLMISGVDKYFQLAKCFRDEDLRSDRQPEFTQLDMEMSFITQDDILSITNHLIQLLWKTFKNQSIDHIPSLSYPDAIDKYGTDQPDLRNSLRLHDISELCKNSGFQVFERSLKQEGVIKSIAVPFQEHFHTSRISKLNKEIKKMGLGGLLWVKSQAGELSSPASKWISSSVLKQLFDKSKAKDGYIVFILAGSKTEVSRGADFLIRTLGKEEDLISKEKDQFLWIKDFPLLEYDNILHRWKACHHPFTAPVQEDLHLLLEQKLDEKPIRAQAYDLVCNGQEVAGGSIRIHQTKTQQAMFKALSLTEEERKEKFGFFLEALQYGTPPHGGIAWGMERLLMLLCETEHIRDVMAFPKTSSGVCLMSSAPSLPHRNQLLELGIQLMEKQSLK